MNPLSFVYTEILFRPLFNLLVGITNVLPTHNVGWAIIILTALVRLVLLPSSLHHARGLQRQQLKMKELQTDLEDIKSKHKNDKGKQAQATMELYRKAGINPASGCLPLLIQLPILIALYRVFFTGLNNESFHWLYAFVSRPTIIMHLFLATDLSTPSLVFALLAGVSQFIQMRWLTPTPPPQPGANEDSAAAMESMQKNMRYIFPVMTVFISLRLPAALALYWVTSTVFGMIQQLILKRSLHLTVTPPTA